MSGGEGLGGSGPRGQPTSGTHVLHSLSGSSQTFDPRGPWFPLAICYRRGHTCSATEQFPSPIGDIPMCQHSELAVKISVGLNLSRTSWRGTTCWTSVPMRTTVGIVTHFVQISKECICRESSSIRARLRTRSIQRAGSSLARPLSSDTSTLLNTQPLVTGLTRGTFSAKEASGKSRACGGKGETLTADVGDSQLTNAYTACLSRGVLASQVGHRGSGKWDSPTVTDTRVPPTPPGTWGEVTGAPAPRDTSVGLHAGSTQWGHSALPLPTMGSAWTRA